MAYEYLKNNYNITEDQFKNLLCFLIIITNEHSRILLGLSPDYILDKYHRYVNNIASIQNSNDYNWGTHPMLHEITKEYHEKWGYPKDWKLKPLLKNI